MNRPGPDRLPPQEELARLREKRKGINDREILAVLDLRIQQIEDQLAKEAALRRAADAKPTAQASARVTDQGSEPEHANSPGAAPVASVEAETPGGTAVDAGRPEQADATRTEPADSDATDSDAPLTPSPPEAVEQAEQLLRRAHLEKNRGNRQAAGDLLKQAVAAAPNSRPVQEAVGDAMMERREYRKAREAYDRALKLGPKNVNLERKQAEAVFQERNAGSIEMQLRLSLGDGLLPDEGAAMASGPAALLLTALIPGLGHLVLGRRNVGFGLLAAWVALAVWLLLMGRDVTELGRMIAGQPVQPNLLVLLPMFLMVATYISAVVSLKGAEAAGRRRVDRPRPPVDLPFD